MTLLTFILFMIYVLCVPTCPHILIEKTKPNEIETDDCKTKYIVLFCVFNIFCFLFLNKIREYRKIDYYKSIVLYYTQYKKSFGTTSLSEENEKEYIKMKRYLKLKKLK